MFDNLTNDNFVLYAAKHYDNIQCTSVEEFEEDLKRIKYIKRLFRQFETSGVLRERLVMNHLTVLFNVFPPPSATRMLALKLDKYLHILKPFLIYMGRWPDQITGIGPKGLNIRSDDVTLNQQVVDVLRNMQ